MTEEQRKFYTKRRMDLLMGCSARALSVTPPEPAKLVIRGEVVIPDREAAYAFACQLMQEADNLWLRARD